MNTSDDASVDRTASGVSRPTRSTVQFAIDVSIARRVRDSNGPLPTTTSRIRLPRGSPWAACWTIVTSGTDRLRGAKRMTATMRNSSLSPATGTTRQRAASIPLGTSVTGTAAPTIRRIGSAAASLTAVSATPHDVHDVMCSANWASGRKTPPHTPWIVTTVGSPSPRETFAPG